jgi:hypothetical protein
MQRISRIALVLTSLTTLIFADDQNIPNHPQVSIMTTKGEIVVELKPEKAPKTVANFLEYVNAGFYDNTIFHRVIKGFMIQGGGLTADMKKKRLAIRSRTKQTMVSRTANTPSRWHV